MWAWTIANNPRVSREKFDPTPNGVVEVFSGDLDLVLSDFTFSKQEGTKGTEIIGTQTFLNNANATITDSFTYSSTKTESFTLKFSEGLKVGTKATVKTNLGFIVKGRAEINAEITFSSDQTWSSQVAETFADTITISVPAHSRLSATAILNIEKGVFNFKGIATATSQIVDAVMWFKGKDGGGSSWHVPLKVLLSADADRQVPVSGTVDGALAVSVTVSTDEITI